MKLDDLLPFLIGGGGVVAILILVAWIRSFLHICPPNEVLIFSGRKHRMADGTSRGFRVVFGGRGWRVPVIENVSGMSLNVMEVKMAIRNAYSRGGIPLNVDAIANVKVSSDRMTIGNAIERFLGRDPAEIARVAKETLEGHLRGVLATLTPEEVNEDRLKFTGELTRESEEDLQKLGIHLDTLKIRHVADDQAYLSSIGRQAIANVLKDAEIAESDAKREAEQSVAENAGRAKVTEANVEAQVARLKNDLRRVQAELTANVQSEERRTVAAAREARAVAERELQELRGQLEELRLKADAVLPAEAERTQKELAARGDAAAIRERGKAVAQATTLLREAFAAGGSDAMSIYLIENLDKILYEVAWGVQRVKVQQLDMIDGGDGQTLKNYVAAYPAMMSAVLDAVERTTGIDIPAVVSGRPSAAKADKEVRS